MLGVVAITRCLTPFVSILAAATGLRYVLPDGISQSFREVAEAKLRGRLGHRFVSHLPVAQSGSASRVYISQLPI